MIGEEAEEAEAGQISFSFGAEEESQNIVVKENKRLSRE